MTEMGRFIFRLKLTEVNAIASMAAPFPGLGLLCFDYLYIFNEFVHHLIFIFVYLSNPITLFSTITIIFKNIYSNHFIKQPGPNVIERFSSIIY